MIAIHIASLVLAAQGTHPASTPATAPRGHATASRSEAGQAAASARLHWLDVNGDGSSDVLARDSGGRLRLLVGQGDGSFVEETDRRGLGDASGVDCVLSGDVDLDGEVDLVLGTSRGLVVLLQQQGVFVGMAETAGLADVGSATDLAWVDADGDRYLDLQVVTNAGAHRIFAGRAGGTFEELDLGLGPAATFHASGTESERNVSPAFGSSDGLSAGEARDSLAERLVTAGTPSPISTAGTGLVSNPGATLDVTAGTSGPAVAGATVTATETATDLRACAPSIDDMATTNCIAASSVPTYGMLYPLGDDFFVDAATGNVGIGTTSPGHALEVSGKIISGNGNTSTGLDSAVGGGAFNIASSDRSTVAGGVGNSAAYRAAVGGGDNNRATGNISTVSGGKLNDALQTGATVGGGEENEVDATHATIAGGQSNIASGNHASVGGGLGNIVTGAYGAVPGGRGNLSSGAYSQAAGRRARAVHDGAFVWADSEDADFASTAPDQFLVRALGGVGIGTDTPRGLMEVAGSVRSSGTGASFTVYNPNNVGATASLNWLDNVARIRVGGSGTGSGNGLDVQTVQDESLMRITGDGEVGIGTDSPQVRLHVDDGTDVQATSGGYLQLGDADQHLAIDDNEIMARDTLGPARLNLNVEGGDIILGGTSDAKVAVGTSVPTSRLHVEDDADEPVVHVEKLPVPNQSGPALFAKNPNRGDWAIEAEGSTQGILVRAQEVPADSFGLGLFVDVNREPNNRSEGIRVYAAQYGVRVFAEGEGYLGTKSMGVLASSLHGYGGLFESYNDDGLVGQAIGPGSGVRGLCYGTGPNDHAVEAVVDSTISTGRAVSGTNPSPNGFGGWFSGGKHYFSGPIGCGDEDPQALLHIVSSEPSSDPDDEVLIESNRSATLRLEADTGNNLESSQPSIVLTQDGGAISGSFGFFDSENTLSIRAQGDASGTDMHIEPDGGLRVEANDDVIIETAGGVGIRTSSPSFLLEVNGSAGKPGGGSWSSSSDRRLKKNVADLEGALDTLLALRGVTFEYKDPASINELEGTRTGFIAQEVEEVLPDWVSEKPDGMKMVTVRGFEALAVEALRELHAEKDAELDALRARVEVLERELARSQDVARELVARFEQAMAQGGGEPRED